jgi:L-2-hydroxyglutarate oxidase LhgO
MSETLDCLVIGAGVIGLAVARDLAMAGREVVVIDEADGVGTQTSSRNSEVIHAGIYYPAGSSKAHLCVVGRAMLYRYCTEHGVAHRKIGKLIVATDTEQLGRLDAIAARAAANGVTDLQRLDRAGAAALEPDLDCLGALLSPSTGIVDSHGLMASLQHDAEVAGATTILRTGFSTGRVHNGKVVVDLDGTEVECTTVINCAGLGAWDVASAITGFPRELVPDRFLAKGNYFVLESGRVPFSRLIYPVPADGGLGVHLTLDLGGQARFGPDVEWLDHMNIADVDYEVDPDRGDRFYDAIRRYWPDLPTDSLVAGYCGVRPKLSGPGQPDADFLIQGPADHGIPGLVNLFGIESPGLTSSLAIAQVVAEMVR